MSKPENVLFVRHGPRVIGRFRPEQNRLRSATRTSRRGAASRCAARMECMAPEVLGSGRTVEVWIRRSARYACLRSFLSVAYPLGIRKNRSGVVPARIRRAHCWSLGTWSAGIRGRGGTLCGATPRCWWRERTATGALYNDPSEADIKNDRYFAFCGGLEDLPTMEPPFNPSSSATRTPALRSTTGVANERAPSRRRDAPLSSSAVARNFEAWGRAPRTGDAPWTSLPPRRRHHHPGPGGLARPAERGLGGAPRGAVGGQRQLRPHDGQRRAAASSTTSFQGATTRRRSGRCLRLEVRFFCSPRGCSTQGSGPWRFRPGRADFFASQPQRPQCSLLCHIARGPQTAESTKEPCRHDRRAYNACVRGYF